MKDFSAVSALLIMSTVASFAHGASPRSAPAQAAELNPWRLAPDHATISVASMDAASAWYQRVLGFREVNRTQRGPDRTVCHLTIPGYRIDLLSQAKSVRAPQLPSGQQQGWLNVVLKTPSLEAVYKHLLAENVTVRVDRDAKGALEHLTLHDSEGNEIGIADSEGNEVAVGAQK